LIFIPPFSSPIFSPIRCEFLPMVTGQAPFWRRG
jgi:hypothetical protein